MSSFRISMFQSFQWALGAGATLAPWYLDLLRLEQAESGLEGWEPKREGIVVWELDWLICIWRTCWGDG